MGPGIHRIEDAATNSYPVEEDGRPTVADCGVPTSWASLEDTLRQPGRSKDAIEAVVLTHANRPAAPASTERRSFAA